MIGLCLGLALSLQDAPPKLDEFIERARKAAAAVEPIRAEVTYPSSARPKSVLEHAPGSHLAFHTISSSSRAGLIQETLIFTGGELSYRTLRFGPRTIFAAGRSDDPGSADLQSLTLVRQAERAILGVVLAPDFYLRDARQIATFKEGDKTYLRIERAPVGDARRGQPPMVPVLIFEAETGRLARAIDSYGNYEYIYTIEEWKDGLPAKVTATYGFQDTPPHTVFELRRLEGAPAPMPAWAKQPLPSVKGEDVPSKALAALVANDLEAAARLLDQEPLGEMKLGLMLAQGKREEFEKGLEGADPALYYIASLKADQDGDAAGALQWLKRCKAEGILAEFQRRGISRLTLAAIEKPEELAAKVKELAADPARRLEVAGILEPFVQPKASIIEDDKPIITSKPKEFIEALEAFAAEPAIGLALARHYARQGEGPKASKFYEPLLADEALFESIRGELETVAKNVSQTDALVERLVIKGSQDAGVLILHAIAAAGKDAAAARESTRRVLEGLPRAAPQDLRRLGELSEKLFDAGEKELAEKLMAPWATTLNYLNDEQRKIYQKVLGNDKDKLFMALRQVKYNAIHALRQAGVEYKDVIAMIRKRDLDNQADETDYHLVCDFIRMRQQNVDAGALLQRAVERFPEVYDFREGRADALALAGEWAEAAKELARAVDLRIAGRRPKVNRGYASNLATQNRQYQPYDPLPIKVALAFRESKNAPGGAACLEKLQGARERMMLEHTAVAYELLGMTEQAIQAYRQIFFKDNARQPTGDISRAAANMVALLEKCGRAEEAYFAAEQLLAMHKDGGGQYWNPQGVGEIQQARERLRKKLGEDAFIKVALEMKLEPLPAEEESRVRELAHALGAELPQDRQGAHAELAKLGPRCGYLLKEFANHDDPEVRSRARQLLFDWGEAELRKRFEK